MTASRLWTFCRRCLTTCRLAKMCAQSTQRLQLPSAMPIVDNELIASTEGPELLLPFESVGTAFDKVLRRNLSQHGDAVWLVSCLR